jgi:hypothetical protein
MFLCLDKYDMSFTGTTHLIDTCPSFTNVVDVLNGIDLKESSKYLYFGNPTNL